MGIRQRRYYTQHRHRRIKIMIIKESKQKKAEGKKAFGKLLNITHITFCHPVSVTDDGKIQSNKIIKMEKQNDKLYSSPIVFSFNDTSFYKCCRDETEGVTDVFDDNLNESCILMPVLSTQDDYFPFSPVFEENLTLVLPSSSQNEYIGRTPSGRWELIETRVNSFSKISISSKYSSFICFF